MSRKIDSRLNSESSLRSDFSESSLRDDQDRRPDHDDPDQHEQGRSDLGLAEGVDRLQHARANEERAGQRERERRADQRDVPDAQHAAALLDHDRVQEGGAGQPRDQGGVLDRVPGPVAAPAEFAVGPAGSERQADGQEDPGDQGEAAGRADPAGVEAAGDQGADRECERDREEDVAGVERRRMHRHRRMAEQRRQPGALGRHRVGGGERPAVGAREEDPGDHQAEEEDGDAGEDRRGPGHDLAVTVAGDVEDGRRGDREHERPEQQRAGLAAPEGGELVEQRRRRRGVVGDERDGQVGADEEDLERDRRDQQEAEHRVDGAAGGDHPAAIAAGADQRGDAGVDRDEQRGDEGRGPECAH